MIQLQQINLGIRACSVCLYAPSPRTRPLPVHSIQEDRDKITSIKANNIKQNMECAITRNMLTDKDVCWKLDLRSAVTTVVVTVGPAQTSYDLAVEEELSLMSLEVSLDVW